MDRQRELFAQAPVRSDFGKRMQRPRGGSSFGRSGGPRGAGRGPLVVILVAAFILGGGLLGYFFRNSSSTGDEIPLIKAALPIKNRPEQPGGIDIPHQDVTIFEKLDPQSETSASKIEHLLPPAETPSPVAPSSLENSRQMSSAGSSILPDRKGTEIERDLAPRKEDVQALPKTDAAIPPAASDETPFMPAPPEKSSQPPEPPPPAPLKTEADKPPQIKDLPIKSATEKQQAPKPVAEKPASPKKVEKPQEPKVEAPLKHAPTTMGSLPAELFRTGEVPAHLKSPQASVAPSASRLRLQLAAAPDKATAAAEMIRLQSKYGAALSGVKLLLLQGTAAGKTIYRIQSVPLAEADAKKICASLQDKKASCLLVKP